MRSLHEPRTRAAIGQCRVTERGQGAGPVCLIGVVFSGSLPRDRDRQLRKGGGWGVRLNVQPGRSVDYRDRTTHD